MGIVLPEGVLNNSALQKVREYFEGRAKILLICSIPQDVFIAAGATVKPSLLFLKKFTKEEEKQWNEIQIKVREEVNQKYNLIITKERQSLINAEKEFEEMNKQLKSINILKGRKKGNIQINQKEYDKLVLSVQTQKDKIKVEQKIFKTKEKQYEQEIQIETRKQIKEKFDYEIAIVQVEKAGITATGAPCKNELPDVAKESKEYRINNKLWPENRKSVIYSIEQEEVFRIVAGEKQEIYD
jgi:type I restriction enzyme M protein